MCLARLSSELRTWITNKVRIDAFDLDDPTNIATVIDNVQYPANTGYEVSVDKLTYSASEPTSIIGSGVFKYVVVYRFTHLLAYNDLPINSVRAVLSNVLFYALREATNISDLVMSLTIPEQNEIIITRDEKGSEGDWLIVMPIALEITFYVEECETDLQPTTPLPIPLFTRLDIGVYRSYSPPDPSDSDTHILDTLIQIPKD